MLKYNYCTYKGDNQMTENTYILAVDPGNEKTGVAILSPFGEYCSYCLWKWYKS